MRIELASEIWRKLHPTSFDVFASGFYIATVDTSQSELVFDLPDLSSEVIEISLRRRPGDLRSLKGLHQNSMRILAPVKSIEFF